MFMRLVFNQRKGDAYVVPKLTEPTLVQQLEAYAESLGVSLSNGLMGWSDENVVKVTAEELRGMGMTDDAVIEKLLARAKELEAQLA
mmetsp:Transcript_32772/g.91796  ORF Transcript_32772/g.91796 Transcript_32772/m.91796 type:complete len:87 (+) Transcript_32772:136-396(+)